MLCVSVFAQLAVNFILRNLLVTGSALHIWTYVLLEACDKWSLAVTRMHIYITGRYGSAIVNVKCIELISV